jgi:hypothetical protein
VFTDTGADGVASAAINHPLDTSKTALVNSNLMTAGAITPDSISAGCNMFNDIKDFAGNHFKTKAKAILAHANNQTLIQSIYQSNLKALELSNTKNALPTLQQIYGTYISKTYWHLLDTSIPSFIFQRRSKLQPFDDQDKISTLNYYWAMIERYKAAQINPGFGHISNPYAG